MIFRELCLHGDRTDKGVQDDRNDLTFPEHFP
jgi:hypothetical protein